MRWKLPEELLFLQNGKIEPKKSKERIDGKVCVVTGGTSGVGLEAVKKLAQGGGHIVLVARNSVKAKTIKEHVEKKHGVKVDIYVADFSHLQQVREVARKINQAYPRIDLLINSVGVYSTKPRYTEEGFELVYCVNHLGPFLFTYLLLEKMKRSTPARIIQVGSEGHRFGGLSLKDIHWKKRFYTGLRGYGASKTAQLLTVWEFADVLQGTGVTINVVHPGEVRTNIGNNNGWLYRWFSRHVTWHFLKDPKESGEAIYYLASAPELKDVSGVFFNKTTMEKPAKHALNRKIGKQVWDNSLQMTGLQ